MKTCFVILFSLLFLPVFSQVSISDGGVVNACGGTFVSGNVQAGQTYSITLCADGSGNSHVKVTFTSWDVVAENHLCVYDGPNSGAPLIGCYDNTNWGSTQSTYASPANLSGCLTFVLTSTDGTANWSGNIFCEFSCQPFYSELLSTTPASVSGFTDVCKGTTITFNGSGDYYVNDTLYHQSNSTSSFLWNFDDGTTASGEIVSHTFNQSGGYDIGLTITDQFGCVSSNSLGHRVRVSLPPDFSGTKADNSSICPGETLNLSGIVNPDYWTSKPVNTVAGETYLPDGSGASYSTSVLIEAFNPDQTLTDINDIEGICVNMEHSYLGDLVISIMCPNGTQVVLEDQGGDGTYLGEPVDVEDPDRPGVGYDYCWSASAEFGIMSEEAIGYTTLPSGSYTSYQSLSDLTGCPLNGTWTINVMDNYPNDDGFIFSWGINFADHLYPNMWNFTQSYSTEQMSWTGNGIDQQGSANATLTTTGSGPQNFTFSVTDNFGCSYDTTINVVVMSKSDPACCVTTIPYAGTNAIVEGDTCMLEATPTDTLNTFSWTYTGTGAATFSDSENPSTQVVVSEYGEYTFTFTEDFDGCTASDQVTILFFEKPDTVEHIIIIPNTFTPNGDDYNDTWVISGVESLENVKVFVYNRYGARVFHSDGVYSPWDGKYAGTTLPTASYYYVIKIKDIGEYKGIVNIVSSQ